ncbi:MAG TPA: hypothetical protein VHE56_12850 [Mycobacteriales bacterium]|nr:hypothetical protein [Mycobacteriales bacterium]
MSLDGFDDHPTAARHELPAIVIGLLVFVVSFLPWYGVSFDGGSAEAGVTGTYNAWHGLAGVGIIVVLLSLVVTAAEPFFGETVPRIALPLAAAVLSVVGTALVAIKSFNLPEIDIPNTTTSLRWGGWALLVVLVLQVMVSVLRVVHANDAQPHSASG